MDNNNFQRIGTVSNAQAGNDFEAACRPNFFSQQGIPLVKSFSVPVGVGEGIDTPAPHRSMRLLASMLPRSSVMMASLRTGMRRV